MNERRNFHDGTGLAAYLGNPYLILAYEIFRLALQDCEDWTRHDELRRFAESEWSSTLLMGAAAQEEIVELFETEMKTATKDKKRKGYGFLIAINNERLYEARIKADMSQWKAAKLLKCTQSTISKYETSGTRVPSKMLKELCRLYGCAEEEIRRK